MFGIPRLVPLILVATSVAPAPTTDATAHDRGHLASLDPALAFVGGSASARKTVNDAVERFVTTGLALPDLVVRFHDEPSGCAGMMGAFRDGDAPTIDLCFDRQFLALHELGHAWERSNLDDRDRERFRALVGAPTWRDADVRHNQQGVEIAANVLAHGLLSTPLPPGQHRDREFARFEALTGFATPRLSEFPCEASASTEGSTDQLRRLARYNDWRRDNASDTSWQLPESESYPFIWSLSRSTDSMNSSIIS